MSKTYNLLNLTTGKTEGSGLKKYLISKHAVKTFNQKLQSNPSEVSDGLTLYYRSTQANTANRYKLLAYHCSIQPYSKNTVLMLASNRYISLNNIQTIFVKKVNLPKDIIQKYSKKITNVPKVPKEIDYEFDVNEPLPLVHIPDYIRNYTQEEQKFREQSAVNKFRSTT